MQTRSTVLAVGMMALGGLLGWLAASGQLTTAYTQDKLKADSPLTGGTPLTLPRPDFRFPGNVGRTYLDSDPPQFPQPVQAPRGAPNIVLILIDDTG